MKTLIKATVITLTLGLTTLYAGSGHDHGHGHSHGEAKTKKSQSSIKILANQKLAQLVQYNKIDKAWAKTPISDMQKKQFHHNLEWVVSYKNKNVTDKTKDTLYIFLDLYGKPTGANFTGK